MYIDNQVGDIALKNIDDVCKSIENDMLSGEYIKWSYIDPDDKAVREITPCSNAKEYVTFVSTVKAIVPSKAAGRALIMYRAYMSPIENEFALFAVQK